MYLETLIKIIYLYAIFRLLKYLKYPKLKRHPKDIFSPHKTFIESHRGINREIFQNTLEAFSKAIKYNIGSLEIDVWLTKDKIPVIHHGYGKFGAIDGYYDSPGNITQLTYNELSFFRTIKDKLKMPTLRETFELTKNKIFINLEIKDKRIDLAFPYIIKLIEDYNFFNQITISSFNHKYYDKIVEYNYNNNKELVFGFLYNRNQTEFFDYTKRGNSLNIYWTDATKEVCDKAHKNGMAVLVWFEMDDIENDEIYRQLVENGVDIICSNEPVLAKKYLRYYYYYLKK